MGDMVGTESSIMIINRFVGKYRFLSNFYLCPIKVQEDVPEQGIVNVVYPSVEHAYQAAKSFESWYKRGLRETDSPVDAKRMGKGIRLRPDWDSVKVNIMLELLHKKFSQPDLRAMLLSTGDAELIEGNDRGDKEWGVYGGDGENLLGKLLMRVRDNIWLEESVLSREY